MLISKPRATCKTKVITGESDIEITASEYQIIMAFTTLQPRRNQFGETIESTQLWEVESNKGIPKIVDKAISDLVSGIKKVEQLKIQCTMIGETLFSPKNTGEENLINNSLEFVDNKRK